MLPQVVPRLFTSAVDPLVIDDKVVLLLHFDIGVEAATVWSDYSTALQKGGVTAAGNATLVGSGVGLFSSVAGFDGTGDYAQFNNSPDYNMGSGDFTIDFWFNPATAGNGTSRRILFQSDASLTATSISFGITLGTTNLISAGVNQGSSSVTVNSTTTFTTAGWRHVAFVRLGNVLKLFINGVQEGGNVAISGAINSSANKLGIGCLGEWLTGQMYNGYLDELRISKGIARWIANFTPPAEPYKYPFAGGNDSFTKLLVHTDTAHGSTTIVDRSQTSKGNIVASGASVSSQSIARWGSASMYFSGALTDRFTAPAHADFNFGSGDFTIDFWAVVNAFSNPSGNHLSTFSRRTGTDTNNYYALLFLASGAPQFQVVVGGTGVLYVTGSAGVVPVFGWHHYAMVRNGTSWRIYQDGVMKAETIQDGTIPDWDGSFIIGAGPGNNYPFNGWIDEFRVTKGIARWTSNFTPPKGPYGPDGALPPAVSFAVIAPGSATIGTAFNVTVQARDAFGSIATGYTGIVHFTSTNGSAVLPADTTLVNGVKTVAVTFNTSGNWTVTATDTVTGSITGTSGSVSTVAGPPFTKLLLHFSEGSNSTTTADSSGYNHGVTLANGAKIINPPIDTGDPAKFGNCLLMIPFPQYAYVNNNAFWNFGANDFTVEWWEYRITAKTAAAVIARDSETSPTPYIFAYELGNGNCYCYMTSNGSAWDISNGQYWGPVVLASWHHRAISRQGTTFRLFYDGVVQAAWNTSLAVLANSGNLSIGRNQATTAHFEGFLEEIRVSNICRYTANFTPASAQFTAD